MKRKLIAGAVVMALTLTTGTMAYAVVGPQENEQSNGGVYRNEISMGGEGALSFENIDKNNLPEGVRYVDEISVINGNVLPLQPDK